MANAFLAAGSGDNLVTFQTSRAAYALIQRHGDRFIAAIQAVVPIKGASVALTMLPSTAVDLEKHMLGLWTDVDRSLKKTITALSKSIVNALGEYQRRDIVPDPGLKVIRDANNDGARLRYGDVVIDINDELSVVLEGPDFYKVANRDGIHAEADGCRYNWRFGYMIARCKDGGILSTTRYFSPVHALWAKDGSGQTHLKLVRG